MIVTRPIAIRIGILIVATVILQAAFFSELGLLGAAPNVVPIVVVSLGLLGGGVVGAACGFATGFLLDSVLLQTLGVSSLVLLSVGYLAGRYRENGLEITGGWTAPLLAGGFTLLAAGGFAALQLMLGVDSAVSLLVVREIFVQALLAVLLAFPIYALIRKGLAPALIDYAPQTHKVRLRLPGLPRRRAARRRARASASVIGARRRARAHRGVRRRPGARGGVA